MTIPEQIKTAERILIIGHQRPDGDCIGAGLALMHVCEKYGKVCDFLFDSPVPEHFSFLDDYDKLNRQSTKNYDLVICVDCADEFRTGRYIGYLQKANTSINIDHHKTNNKYARTNIVVPDASSTCEILYGLLSDAGEINKEIAYLLFMGLSTDTGHFMHSNTNSRVFAIASSLTEYGISPNAIASNLYKNMSYSKIKLISRAIQSMRFFAENKICLISIMTSDLSDCGCVLADTEGLIDYGMMINTVEVAICISEQNSTQFKVSYRSKGLDVAAAAAVFGGGGHKLAAGCSVSGKYEDVVRKIVKSVTDGMNL